MGIYNSEYYRDDLKSSRILKSQYISLASIDAKENCPRNSFNLFFNLLHNMLIKKEKVTYFFNLGLFVSIYQVAPSILPSASDLSAPRSAAMGSLGHTSGLQSKQ